MDPAASVLLLSLLAASLSSTVVLFAGLAPRVPEILGHTILVTLVAVLALVVTDRLRPPAAGGGGRGGGGGGGGVGKRFVVVDVFAEFGPEEEEMECMVCLESCHDWQNLLALSCSHWYHQSCIERWFKRKRVCPLCYATVVRSATT
mmetsp:Transcript_20120/g.49907  ORF Transcript_20120/g.49907 Transcript_20120/m.49907 type:complete len:147 (-) Transcript_20120:147-587(-)